jgi:hypothetical protein
MEYFGVRMANLPIGRKSDIGLMDGLFRSGGSKDMWEWDVDIP